jgi:hypothetical protein
MRLLMYGITQRMFSIANCTKRKGEGMRGGRGERRKG